jgi:hypothetical protein
MSQLFPLPLGSRSYRALALRVTIWLVSRSQPYNLKKEESRCRSFIRFGSGVMSGGVPKQSSFQVTVGGSTYQQDGGAISPYILYQAKSDLNPTLIFRFQSAVFVISSPSLDHRAENVQTEQHLSGRAYESY